MSPLHIIRDIGERKEVEVKLQETEQRYRTLFEQSPEAILIVDPETHLPIEFNDEMLKLLGYSHEEFARMRISDYEASESSEEIREHIEKVLSEGSDEFETKLRAKNGEVREVLANVRRIELSQRMLLYSIIRDVTARRRVEEALRSSEEKYRSLFELASDAIMTVLPPAGKILDSNTAAERLLGYSKEELRVLSGREIIAPETLEQTYHDWTSQVEEKGQFLLETSWVHKNGSRIPVAVSGKPLELAGQTHFQLIGRDITAQKQAEARLRKSEERNRAMVNAIPDMIFRVDTDGCMLDFKAEQSQLMMPAEKIIGTKLEDALMPGGVVELLMKTIRAAVKTGEVQRSEYELPTPDGHKIYEARMVRSAPDECICIVREITEQKRSEEALRRSHRTFEFLAKYNELTSGLSVEAVVETTLEFLKKELSPKQTSIAMLTSDRGNLWLLASTHPGETGLTVGSSLPLGSTVIAEVVKQHTPRYRPDIAAENSGYEVDKKLLEYGLRSNFLVPLWVGKECIGTLNMGKCEIDGFSEQDRQLAALLAPRLAHALQNAKLFEELQKSELSLRQQSQIIDQIHDSVVSTDLNGIITSWNRGAERLFGYSAEEMLGKHIAVVYPEEEHDFLQHQGIEPLKEKGEHNIEVRMRRKSGEDFFAHLSLSLRHDERGNVNGMISYSIDITERKQAEEHVRASLKEKEVLLKEVHHRVKNNLQIISSLLRLQSAKIKSKQVRDVLQESQSRVKSMALIHEKLYQTNDFSKINFAEYIKNLTSQLFRMYSSNDKPIILKLNVDDVFMDTDTAITCGLIVNELVCNALKHAFPKSGDKTESRIQVDLRSNSDDEITLKVRDNGQGLPRDVDVRNSDSLGLQLVCSLTDQLQGRIRLDRKRGTAFAIRFKRPKSVVTLPA